MQYKYDEFDPAEVQVFITKHKLYNIRSPKTFEELFPVIPRLRVDGFLTRQQKMFKSKPDNIYNNGRGVFFLNGEPFNVVYKDVHKVRNHFYFPEESEEMRMLSVYEIYIPKSENNKLLNCIRSDGRSKTAYSLAFNLKLPTIDTVAPKLMMD